MKPEMRIVYDKTTSTVQLSGYAYDFDDYEVQGGPGAGGWIERIDRDALMKPRNVLLLINFDSSRSVARTSDGTLQLSIDDVGLKVSATPHGQAWADTSIRATLLNPQGDVKPDIDFGMSFRVKKQHWSTAPGHESNPISYRLITKLDLLNIAVIPKTVAPAPRETKSQIQGGDTA